MRTEKEPRVYELTGATLIDPCTRSVAVSTVAVDEGRIRLRAAARATHRAAIDGMFVMPGLIDMHTHLIPSLVGGRAISDEVFTRCENTLRRVGAAGITAVRDLGGPLAESLMLRRGNRSGVRVFLSGPVLTAADGHGAHTGQGVVVESVRAAAAFVEVLAGAGVDHVKIVTSGARGAVQLSAEVFDAAVIQARSVALPVAVHAHFQLPQIERAVRAGVDSLEHGFLLHRRPDLLKEMAASGVALCPTLRVIESIRSDPTWYGQQLIPRAWDDALASTRAALGAGVRLIAGTDHGVFGVKESDVWQEVSLISRCTGDRWNGLASATCDASATLRRPDLGNLADGAVADLVVLHRNPLTEEVAAADVAATVVEGKLIAGSLPFKEITDDY